MLENIMNNINATQELPNSKIKTKKTDDKVDKTEGDDTKMTFQDLLKKNLEKNNETKSSDDKKISNSVKKDPKSSKLNTSTLEENPDDKNTHLVDTNHTKIPPHVADFDNKPSSKIDNKVDNKKDFPLKNTLNESKTNEDIKNDDKKISDVKNIADEKSLNAKNIKATTTAKIEPENKSNITEQVPKKQLTQSLLEQKNVQQTSKNKEPENKPPLNVFLGTIDEKALKARKKFNDSHKIEYKVEGKDEKIAIIERGSKLPKNIVGPKLMEEKKEAKLLAEVQKSIEESNKTNEAKTDEVKTNDVKSKTPSLKEGIALALNKDIKLKKTDEGLNNDLIKDSSQKKTKKSSLKKSVAQSTSKVIAKEPQNNHISQKEQILEQNKDFQDKVLNDQNNTQTLVNEKTKKTQNNKEAKESKEKIDSNPSSTHKDNAISLGAMPKSDLLFKSTNAKETLKNFAQNLSDEIKNYKPPMSKISLELHPEKLGKLELTIKQVGKNLHVNVVSNNQAIALFLQNQSELRNNLAMIGFSGVDLNFSSSSSDGSKENNQNSNQKRNKNSLQQYEEVKNSSSTPAYDVMDIVLPKYA